MNEQDNRIKLDIFRPKTTYQNDFEKRSIMPTKPFLKKQDYEPKPIEAREYVIRDNETFTYRRKETHIPFNLLWRSKEIVGTNPYEPFQIQAWPETPGKTDAIKTRPRIYMSPAISMDDVDDAKMRDLLCSQMYTSETTRATKESALTTTEKHIPNSTLEKNGDPVGLKVDILPPIPNRFRGEKSKEWETQQRKLAVDPTKTFWENNTVECGNCVDPVAGLISNEIKQEIKTLISQDRLRLPHDVPISGYAGYRPQFSYGVPLAKTDVSYLGFTHK